ncbi:S8 family peptidase [bacterium]|nr:S8 family peptidase [bacterium]
MMQPVLISLFITLISVSALAAENNRYWVFFEDKGIPAGQEIIALRQAQTSLSERSLNRRARNCPEIVTAGDVRLNEAYLQQVRETGAVIRRCSKWLNAVSVETTPEILLQLKSLPCVREVRPFSQKATLDPHGSRQLHRSIDDPDYGPSLDQYAMSRIPELHARGLSGEGVLMAFLDTGYNLAIEAFDSLTVPATWDFIFGDSIVGVEEDHEEQGGPWQHNHGTMVLSVAAGYHEGAIVGPAFGAEFLLAKTEWRAGEEQSEEDNYVAALEWADSIGTDITSSSLGYKLWYETSDMDGHTAVTTVAVVEAIRRGILVVTAAGNDRDSDWGTIISPADADSILAVGAVDSLGDFAYFSSPGPSADGRIKPDICAHGVHTYCATHYTDEEYSYTYTNGTSLSTPIISGLAALVMEAHPGWTAQQVREAMIMSASRASHPDNDYGYGIADGVGAVDYVFTSSPHFREPVVDSSVLLRAYPNPLNGYGVLRLTITEPKSGSIRLFDVLGRETMRWDRKQWQAGENNVKFSSTDLASGMYWARFEGEVDGRATKIVVIK